MSDPKRTAFAMQALGLAETFNLMLQAERVKGPVTYRVELSAPDGMSTGGRQAGHAARQARPRGRRHDHRRRQRQPGREAGPSCAPSSISSCLHAQRFKGAEIPLNRVQYNELLDKLQGLLRRAEAARCAWPSCRATPPLRSRRGAGGAGRVGDTWCVIADPRRRAGGGGGRDVVPHAPAAASRRRHRRRRAVAVPARLLLLEGSLRAGAARARRAGVRQGRAGDAAGVRGVVGPGAPRRRRVAGARRLAGARVRRASCWRRCAKSCPSGSPSSSSIAGTSSTSRSTASSTAWRWRSASPPSRTSCASCATGSASACCARIFAVPAHALFGAVMGFYFGRAKFGAPVAGARARARRARRGGRAARRLRLHPAGAARLAGCTPPSPRGSVGAVGVRPATCAPRAGRLAVQALTGRDKIVCRGCLMKRVLFACVMLACRLPARARRAADRSQIDPQFDAKWQQATSAAEPAYIESAARRRPAR